MPEPFDNEESQESQGSKKVNIVLPYLYGEIIANLSKATGEKIASICSRAVIEYVERTVDSDRLKKLKDQIEQ